MLRLAAIIVLSAMIQTNHCLGGDLIQMPSELFREISDFIRRFVLGPNALKPDAQNRLMNLHSVASADFREMVIQFNWEPFNPEQLIDLIKRSTQAQLRRRDMVAAHVALEGCVRYIAKRVRFDPTLLQHMGQVDANMQIQIICGPDREQWLRHLTEIAEAPILQNLNEMRSRHGITAEERRDCAIFMTNAIRDSMQSTITDPAMVDEEVRITLPGVHLVLQAAEAELARSTS